MMPVKLIAHDIGQVLLGWDPEAYYDKQIGERRRRAFFEQVPIEEMNLAVDRGAEFGSTVRNLAAAHPDWHDEIMMWHDDWLTLASPAIDHSVRLMRALRRNQVPVFALSNFGVETYKVAQEAYPFLREFDHEIISGHLGTIKPEPEIYAHLEAATEVAPQNILLVDDRVANIEEAERRGWQTHLFTTPELWAERLVQEGLISQEDAE